MFAKFLGVDRPCGHTGPRVWLHQHCISIKSFNEKSELFYSPPAGQQMPTLGPPSLGLARTSVGLQLRARAVRRGGLKSYHITHHSSLSTGTNDRSRIGRWYNSYVSHKGPPQHPIVYQITLRGSLKMPTVCVTLSFDYVSVVVS